MAHKNKHTNQPEIQTDTIKHKTDRSRKRADPTTCELRGRPARYRRQTRARPAPSAAVLDHRRRGSTTNVALNVVAVGVSNAATGAHGALRIVGVIGSTLHVADCV